MHRLPNETLDNILGFAVQGASRLESFRLLKVNRAFRDCVTLLAIKPLLKHVVIKGYDFTGFDFTQTLLSDRTFPLVEDLKVELHYDEDKEVREGQLQTCLQTVRLFVDKCEQIRSVEVVCYMDPEPRSQPTDTSHIDRDWKYELQGPPNDPLPRPNPPLLLGNYHSTEALDGFANFVRTQGESGRNLELQIDCCSFGASCVLACVGRNDGVIIDQGTKEKNLVLKSTHSQDERAPTTTGRPGGYTHWVAQEAYRRIKYIDDDYLRTPAPGHSAERWAFLADEMSMQRDTLLGASTGRHPDLFLPVPIRGPFHTAISELEEVTAIFREAAQIGQGTGEPHETRIPEAKACLARALAPLKAACDTEDMLAEREQNEDGGEDDEDRPDSSNRSSTDESGTDDAGSDEDDDALAQWEWEWEWMIYSGCDDKGWGGPQPSLRLHSALLLVVPASLLPTLHYQ